MDDSALDCVETYSEVCDYSDDRLTHGGTAQACVRQPEIDCQPHTEHRDQPAIRCRQVQRKVCGPEACPVKEGPLECQEKLKRVKIINLYLVNGS